MRRLLITAILGAALIPVTASHSGACTCVPMSHEEQADAAVVVFAGVARGTEAEGPVGTTTFDADTAYKGEVHPRMQVTHGLDGPACGYTFEDGRRYTVLADRPDGLRLTTGLCHGTVPGAIDAARYGLEATPVSAEGPGADPTGSRWPWVILLAGALVVGGTLVVLRRRGHLGR